MSTSSVSSTMSLSSPSIRIEDTIAKERSVAADMDRNTHLVLKTLSPGERLPDLEYTKRRTTITDGFEGTAGTLKLMGKDEAAGRVLTFGHGAGKLMDAMQLYSKEGLSGASAMAFYAGASMFLSGLRHKKRRDDSARIIGDSINQAYQALSDQISRVHRDFIRGVDTVDERVRMLYVSMARGFDLFGQQLYDVEYTLKHALREIETDLKQLQIIHTKIDVLLISDFIKCCAYVEQFPDRHSGALTMERSALEFYAPTFENALLGISPPFATLNGSLCEDYSSRVINSTVTPARAQTLIGFLLGYASTVLGVAHPTGITTANVPNLALFGLGIERYQTLREYGVQCDYDSSAAQLKKLLEVGNRALSAVQHIQTCKRIFEELFRRYETQLKRLQDLCSKAMDNKNAEIFPGVKEKADANNARIVAATEKYLAPTMTMTGAQYVIVLRSKDNFIAWDSAYAAGLADVLRAKTPSREAHGTKVGLPFTRQLAEVSRTPLQAFVAPLSGPDASPRPVGKYAPALLHKYIKTIPLPLSQLKSHPESPSCTRFNTPAEFFIAEQLGLGRIDYQYYSSGSDYDVREDFTHFGFVVVVSFKCADGRSLPIKHYTLWGDHKFVEPDWNTRLVNYRERGAMHVSFSWQNVPPLINSTYVVDQSSTSRPTITQMIKDTLVTHRKAAVATLYKEGTSLQVDYANALDDLQATYSLMQAYGEIAGFGQTEMQELAKLQTKEKIERYQRSYISTSQTEEAPYFPVLDVKAIAAAVLAKFSRENGVKQNPLATRLQTQLGRLATFAVSFVEERARFVQEEQRQKEVAERRLFDQAEERRMLLRKMQEAEETVAELVAHVITQGKSQSEENQSLRDRLRALELQNEEILKVAHSFRVMLEMAQKRMASSSSS